MRKIDIFKRIIKRVLLVNDTFLGSWNEEIAFLSQNSLVKEHLRSGIALDGLSSGSELECV